MKTRNYTKNENGQVILFVVVAMVIALGLGVAVSARTLSSLSRVSDTDTSSRVLASAEGGAERILQKSYDDLVDLASRCNNYSNALSQPDCVFSYEYSTTPPLKTRAVVAIEAIQDEFYRVNSFKPGEVKQLNLEGYSESEITFCWSSVAPESVDLLYLGITRNSSNVSKGYLKSLLSTVATVDRNSVTRPTVTNSSIVPFDDYEQCANIDVTGLDALRVRPINGTVEKALFSAVGLGNTLPNQGFAIVSYGELDVLNPADGKEIKRAVRVTKSRPYAAYSFFDYAIYSDEGNITN